MTERRSATSSVAPPSQSAQRSPAGGWLRRALTENLLLKVLSLLIALTLFSVVRGAGTVQRSLEVPVVSRLPAPSNRRVLLTDLPDRVRITLRGSPGQIGSLRGDELGPMQLDLSDGHRSSVFFDPASLSVPAGVQVVQVQPASLQLQWDDYVQRTIPVRVHVTGAPAPGTRVVGGVDVAPREVHVTGPALYVDALLAIGTESLDVTGLSIGRHERRVPLAPLRGGVHVSEGTGVRVAFVIEREIVERRFERVHVTAVGTSGVEIRPATVTLVLRGAPAIVNAVQSDALVPTVELPAPLAPRTSVRARVLLTNIPRDTDLVAIEPNEVVVVAAR